MAGGPEAVDAEQATARTSSSRAAPLPRPTSRSSTTRSGCSSRAARRHPLEASCTRPGPAARGAARAARGRGGRDGREALLLKAAEDAAERAPRLQAENERLRDEAAAARKAVDLKGEGAKLQLDANQLKEERLRLALELHEAKQDAAKAKHDAAESREALRSVDGMRATLAESQAALTAARRDVERLVGERAAALEEHGEVLQQAKGLADELDAVRAAHAQVGAQRGALLERLTATEGTPAALRSELQKREEDFHVDLQLFAERDGQQRKALEQRTADLHAARSQAEALQAALDESNAQGAELLAEVERLQGSASAQLELGERAEAERKMAAMRAEIAEVELRRDRAPTPTTPSVSTPSTPCSRRASRERCASCRVCRRARLAGREARGGAGAARRRSSRSSSRRTRVVAQQQLDALRTAQIS